MRLTVVPNASGSFDVIDEDVSRDDVDELTSLSRDDFDAVVEDALFDPEHSDDWECLQAPEVINRTLGSLRRMGLSTAADQSDLHAQRPEGQKPSKELQAALTTAYRKRGQIAVRRELVMERKREIGRERAAEAFRRREANLLAKEARRVAHEEREAARAAARRTEGEQG